MICKGSTPARQQRFPNRTYASAVNELMDQDPVMALVLCAVDQVFNRVHGEIQELNPDADTLRKIKNALSIQFGKSRVKRMISVPRAQNP